LTHHGHPQGRQETKQQSWAIVEIVEDHKIRLPESSKIWRFMPRVVVETEDGTKAKAELSQK
jgi:hypothetical protein